MAIFKFISLKHGKVHEEILAYAKEHEIDLICIGASSMTGPPGKLLSSNVDRVLREAPCPVLVSAQTKFHYSNVQN